MQYTEHLAQKKPEPSDYVNINDLNGNVERIDEEMHGKADRQLSNLDTPQTALYHLGAGVRPNLLDNPYFVGGGTGWGVLPVNQRQVFSVGKAQQFLIDGWKIYRYVSGTAELKQSGIVLTGNFDFGITLETSRIPPIAGLPVTISALLEDNRLISATGVLKNAGSPESISVRNVNNDDFVVNYTYTRLWQSGKDLLYFQLLTDQSKIAVNAVKMEIGDTQTLAYQDADGKWKLLPQPDMDYGTQLEKCQRYLINLDDGSTVSTRNYPGTWIQTTANAGQYVIPLPAVMRAAPGTVHTEGQFYIWGYGNTGAASIPVTLAYAPTASTPNSITMQVAVPGDALPSPTTCYALSRRDPSSRILVSAEL